MKPVQSDKLLDLFRQFDGKGERLPTTWYVNHDGMPLWAQDSTGFCLIAGGMRIQPQMDGPEYRIVDFEDYPDREITIVRVIQVGTDADRNFLESFQANSKTERSSADEVDADELQSLARFDWATTFDPEPTILKEKPNPPQRQAFLRETFGRICSRFKRCVVKPRHPESDDK